MIHAQVSRFIWSFAVVFGKDVKSPGVRYLEFLLKSFVETRNQRVLDLDSPKMHRVWELIEKFFPFSLGRFLLSLCVDGRVLPETQYFLPIPTIRTPASDISDMIRMSDGSLRLLEGEFTQKIRETVGRFGTAFLAIDNHGCCAAQGERVKSIFDRDVSDHGLADDIRRKIEFREAITQFAIREYGPEGRDKVIVLLTSFDVKYGFMYLNLEGKDALSDARVLRDGFTESILESLAHEGKILSTALWVSEGGLLSELFQKEERSIERLEGDYSESMLQFWTRLSSLKEKALPVVRQEVLRVCPELKADVEGLEMRSALLLANAYAGFLLTVDGAYLYGVHRETGVVVSQGLARGPYGRMSPFPVTGNGKNGGVALLSATITFVASIICKNRRRGNFPEGEKGIILDVFSGDVEVFTESPVPVVISERLNKGTSAVEIQELSALEWESDQSWADMDSEACADFLRKKIPNISTLSIASVDQLRTRALALFHPGLPATDLLLAGDIVLLPVLRTDAGEAITVLPFHIAGYSERYLKSIGKM